MTLTSIVLAAAAGWAIAAAGFGLALGKGIRKADEAIVSPEPDAEWLDAWPNEVDMAALVDAEFIALISSTWRWPFDREEAGQ